MTTNQSPIKLSTVREGFKINHNETTVKLPTVRQGPGLVLQHNETAIKLPTVRQGPGLVLQHNETVIKLPTVRQGPVLFCSTTKPPSNCRRSAKACASTTTKPLAGFSSQPQMIKALKV
jgi:hypothetical protein